MSSTELSASDAGGWAARLEIEVVAEGRRARVRRAEHRGPLRIQRAFYPEGEAPAHLYLLHPPGGLVGGDRLEIDVQVRDGASLLVTTPAAQKVYRSAALASTQDVTLRVDGGAALEWLPAETIVFDGARVRLSTRVELARGATFIGWDIGCFGRPASNLPFASGFARQHFELLVGGQPRLNERAFVRGGSPVLDEAFGYDGFTSYGSLYAVPCDERHAAAQVDALRAALAECDAARERRVGVSAVDGVLVVRVLAGSIEAARELLLAAWCQLRPAVLGRPAVLPRIWAT